MSTPSSLEKKDNVVVADARRSSIEPTGDQNGGGYAYDGEEASPMSPGLARMMKDENAGFVSVRDRVANVIAVTLLFAILITSIISIAAGACCIASLSGKPFKHFPLFFGLGGVAPLVIGIVAFLLSVFVLFFIGCCAMGLRRYGMCCYGSSRCRCCSRVCLLGVFPFIVFIVLLAMCILGFTFYSISQQLPPLDKDYTEVTGITGPIEIIRDENGLPHIIANSRRDAYFGQGFAEAQDRLFQLEFHRSVAQGRLSSMVGNDGTATDQSIRTINVRDAAYSMCNSTDAKQLDYFQAFADGVNLYLKRVSKRPVEFFFMSTKPLYFHDPEPFTARDLCLTSRLLQWQMSSNVNVEGQRFALWAATRRNYSQIEELYPDQSTATNTILNVDQMKTLLGEAKLVSGTGTEPPTDDQLNAAIQNNMIAEATSKGTEAAIYDNLLSIVRSSLQAGAASGASSLQIDDHDNQILTPHEVVNAGVQRVMSNAFFMEDGQKDSVFPNKFLYASNAWAARSADGKTVVASDPHLTINLPSIWYYCHLSFPDDNGVQFDTAGVGMVGLSGVHIGKTTHLAWGITMSMGDLQDLFILPPSQFSGLPERTYRYAGVDRVFVSRTERIKVKGKKDIVLHIDDTVLGPVVSTMLGFPPALTVVMSAVPLMRGDDSSIGALLRMSDPSIDTAEKFMTNLLDLQAPGFSIPIGDNKGNLAYVVTGRHPLRNIGHTGRYPTPAFDAPMLLQAMQQAQEQAAAAGQTLPMSEVLKQVPALLQASNWSSYPSGDPSVPAKRVPKEANPHIHIPFDGTAAHISAANQKVMPNGYTYNIGSDTVWPWRGRHVQETLDAKADQLHDTQIHMDLQRDFRSNMWVYDYAGLVASPEFQAAIAGDAKAVAWANRLLNDWDAMTPIGSVEAAFFWRWLQKMAAYPRDIVRAGGGHLWDALRRYPYRMMTAPTPTMLAECASVLGKDPSTPGVCMELGAKLFIEQASEGDMEWGKDLNHLRGIHQMVDQKIIAPLFRREMNKGGDHSSVGVSDHTIEGDMLATQAASSRQVFDLWNVTDRVHLALPGGSNGNPYSKYYDNMWHIYERDEFVQPVAFGSSIKKVNAAHRQTLDK